MYGWIWRHLPFGLPGRIIGSVLLATLAGALLWFWVFPAVEPLLPFDDGQITQDSGPGQQPGQPGQQPGPAATDIPTPPPGVIPYPEDSNNVSPRPSR